MSVQYTPWPIIGHAWAVDFLSQAIAKGRARHAYLIHGAAGLGKRRLALSFAMAQNCVDSNARPCHRCRHCQFILTGIHPDLFVAQTRGINQIIPIEEIRRLSAFLALLPFEMRQRVAILPDFERAEASAQDALLKTLEEPPAHALLLLLAREISEIHPTVLSRCQRVSLRPMPTKELAEQLCSGWDVTPKQANLLAQISGGRPGWAIRALTEPSLLERREAALATLEKCLRQTYAERFVLAEQLAKETQDLKNKDLLIETLRYWLSYWRDLYLLARDPEWPIIHSDRREFLLQCAQKASQRQLLRAIRATHRLGSRLRYNLNLRLALEAMLLEYPRLPR